MSTPKMAEIAERRRGPRDAAQRERQLLTLDFGGVERKRRVLGEIVAPLERRIETLKRDLWRYGAHTGDCPMSKNGLNRAPCDCGLYDILWEAP